MLSLACGLEVILIVKIVTIVLGALGVTGTAAKALEEEPCSDDC